MKFERITAEAFGAKHQHWDIDRSVKWEQDRDFYDRLRREKGENWLSNQLDSFFDFDSNLYLADDGNFYAVHHVMDMDGSFKPLYWWRLKRDTLYDLVKVEYSGGQAGFGDHAVNYMLADIDGKRIYAEMRVPDGLDENEQQTFDEENYLELKAMFMWRAYESGIETSRLVFDD